MNSMLSKFKLTEKATRRTPGIGITIQTPSEFYESDPYNYLHILFWKTSLWFRIPYWLKTKSKWRDCPDWPRPNPGYEKKGYFEHTQRMYGFTTVEESGIHVYYGIQPGSWSSKDPENSDHVKVLGYFWNYEHVRWDAYNTKGEYLCPGNHLREWSYKYEARYRRKGSPDYIEDDETCFFTVARFVYPKSEQVARDAAIFCDYQNFSDVSSDVQIYQFFKYKDHYDGKELWAKCNIEEREWIRGKWPWMRKLLKYVPGCRMIRRAMNIEFSDEVGSRKGSWKGGITGMDYDMLRGESMSDAFARFQKDWRENR